MDMRATRGRALEGLIDRVYDAAIDPEVWPATWQAVITAFDATSGLLSMPVREGAPPRLLAAVGFSTQAARLYEERYHRLDLWAIRAQRLAHPGAVLGQDLIGDAEFAASEVWNDYSRPHIGAFHMVGAVLRQPRFGYWTVGIHRERGAAAFGAEDRRDLDEILIHLRRAFQISARLIGIESQHRLGYAALDALSDPILVVTGDAMVVFANAAAEALSAQPDRVLAFGRSYGLEAKSIAATRQLREMIQDAAQGGKGGALALPRGSGKRPLATVIGRIPGNLAPDGSGAGLALVLPRDLEETGAPTPTLLRQLFGVTPAEADLAEALLTGEILPEIAARRGIHVSTLRTQLSSLLAKTGCRRQGDMMRLMARLTPPREM